MARSVDGQLKGAERLLITDEVAQPKKGDKSVGVSSQYSGNRGKVDNCQVSVAGMKYYQVRKYRAWNHYMTMILLLLLFLMDQRQALEGPCTP